jgi:hypothetical protein
MIEFFYIYVLEILSIWLAISTIIMLLSFELISPYYGKFGLILDRNKLRTAVLTIGFSYIFIVALRIYQQIVVI